MLARFNGGNGPCSPLLEPKKATWVHPNRPLQPLTISCHMWYKLWPTYYLVGFPLHIVQKPQYIKNVCISTEMCTNQLVPKRQLLKTPLTRWGLFHPKENQRVLRTRLAQVVFFGTPGGLTAFGTRRVTNTGRNSEARFWLFASFSGDSA